MLKIKKNVDLGLLLKNGFKPSAMRQLNKNNVIVDVDTKVIGILFNADLSVIYDLVKADLVEKVEDK